MDFASDTLTQIGCVVIASIGLIVLVLSMIRFEQQRPGRFAALIVGALLVLGPMGVVVWGSLSA